MEISQNNHNDQQEHINNNDISFEGMNFLNELDFFEKEKDSPILRLKSLSMNVREQIDNLQNMKEILGEKYFFSFFIDLLNSKRNKINSKFKESQQKLKQLEKENQKFKELFENEKKNITNYVCFASIKIQLFQIKNR